MKDTLKDYKAAYQAVEMSFSSLRQENLSLLAKTNKYRAALEYYADAGNDQGEKAREVLK